MEAEYLGKKCTKGRCGMDAEECEKRINVGAKKTATMKKKEGIIILTPGEGGWDKIGSPSKVVKAWDSQAAWKKYQ